MVTGVAEAEQITGVERGEGQAKPKAEGEAEEGISGQQMKGESEGVQQML